jgi:hypothetical protein
MLRPELTTDQCADCRTCGACTLTPPVHSSCHSVPCMETGTYHACACNHMGGAA